MARVPFADWRPVGNHGGPMVEHRGLVLHVQDGTGSPLGWFANPASSASSHWWIGRDGTLEQYVDSTLAAWTQAAGNYQWCSVETEGYPYQPLSRQQVAMLAVLYRWGMATYGWPAVLAESPDDAGGLGWHGMGGLAWGGHLGCPGDLRKAQRADVLSMLIVPAATVAGPTGEESSVVIAPHPNGQRHDYVTVSADHSIHHWFTAAGDLKALTHELLPGSAKLVSAAWVNAGLFVVVAHGTDDNAWRLQSDGTHWLGGWELMPVGQLLNPAAA